MIAGHAAGHQRHEPVVHSGGNCWGCCNSVGIILITDVRATNSGGDIRAGAGDVQLAVSGLVRHPVGNASPQPPAGPSSGSLGAIVGNFESVTARRISRVQKTPGAPVWQRNYREQIIRNERELNAIRQYIRENPVRWHVDRYCPDAATHAVDTGATDRS